jgi:Predicted membrane protein (DUF2127).
VAFIETSRVVSRWWTTIAGLVLILGGLLAAIYGGVLTGSAPWTTPFPIIGPAPVMPILLSALPAITGIGVIRRAGWARALGVALASAYLMLDVFALITGTGLTAVIDAAVALFVVFSLVRRWTPRGEQPASVVEQ